MELSYYDEMVKNCETLEQSGAFWQKKIVLFGHCNATEELAGWFTDRGYTVAAILDNSKRKQGKCYRGIAIVSPDWILSEKGNEIIVCIATRFYESMYAQLQRIGFTGDIRKVVDYNTYAEYSLSEETMKRKYKRLEYGRAEIEEMEKAYPGHFRIFCPFSALGDIYFCMSYLPYFLQKHGKKNHVICVPDRVCGKVVSLFDDCPVEVMKQKDLDAAVQAELYIQDENAFIAHQDRPYIINLHKALYVKKISLEMIYCCGVFGLPKETKPVHPTRWKRYSGLDQIPRKNAVILAPHAKSVTALPDQIWENIAVDYQSRGYLVFTNVVGEEKPVKGTRPISPQIQEMKSVVEQAGTFIGIRSGLCDVIRTADCRKIALYPDYNYCDTQWKAIDLYSLKEFENRIVKDDFIWRRD